MSMCSAMSRQPGIVRDSARMRLRHWFLGRRENIAGTIYGTIIVMTTIVAANANEDHPSRMAVIVAGTNLVLWLAHFYSQAVGEGVRRGRRLDRDELREIARHELA